MIYFLYWLVSFLVVTHLIASLYTHAKSIDNNAKLLGGFIGAVLRAATFIWFLVSVYPVLVFIK